MTTPTRDLGFLPVPLRLRHDPAKPIHFGLALNVAFGLSSTFVVANLYYCQPLLIELSKSFGVTYNEVSNIPTLVQAGYATGLLLISPLGDLVRRRPLLLLLTVLTTCLTIGLALTGSLAVFEALSFLIGMCSVVPQILIPMAADLAPPERRASAISIVLAGLLCGVLYARVIGGVVAEFVSWRIVYYIAIGVQAGVGLGMYAMLPDLPAKNPEMSYLNILLSMGKFAVTEPVLVQASLLNIAASAVYANFWVTLTFLLGGPPYNYSTLVIGLFGLVGLAGVAMAPFTGRYVDKLVPWWATLVALIGYALFQAIQVGAGGVNVAAVVVATIGLDLFRQLHQISLTTSVFGVDPSARSRLNAVLIIAIFLGQVMGTAVGTLVFVKYGWRASAALSLGWIGFEFLVLFARGPHTARFTWLGYEGGLSARKRAPAASPAGGEKALDAQKAPDVEGAAPQRPTSPTLPTNGDEEKRST